MCSLSNNAPCLRSTDMPEGCPVPVGNSICGETNSLEIMKEFNRLYEERMNQVDCEAGGDYLQEKIKLQHEWIRNLTQQNEMLVMAVQELEYEATERVHQLEEKLKKSAECLCEGEKLLNEKDRTVQELTQKLNYYNSFGDVNCMAQELQRRREECESLKQTTCCADREMESLQTQNRKLESENISLKETLTVDKTHIEQLDEQFQNFLQERDELKRKHKMLEKKSKCFTKEKEALLCKCEVLKTEIQQLKEQNGKLQNEVETMNKQLEKVNNESVACEGRMKEIVEENRKTIEQIISLNEENRNLSKSIDILRQRSEYTTSFTQDEISKLNATIEELRDHLERTRIVQDEEEKGHQQEIFLLNATIENLEHELKSMEEKYEKDAKTCKICKGRSKVGFLESCEVQADLDSKETELTQALNDVKSRMKIEIEKRNNEIQMLKNKVSELETSLNTCDERAANLQEAEQIKKLSKQKRCYEEVIAYFKQEMTLMAEQLNNLQELLTLSNETSQQETGKIMNAFMEVQTINEKLSTQLCACEQKVQLENQMHQIHEAKICELQQLVSEKEMDLSKHDQAILNIRKNLNESLKQNEHLQQTIIQLNETIASLQCAIKQYEYENCASKKSCMEFQEQIGGYCSKLEEMKNCLDQKTAECCKLEMAYSNDKRALNAAQKQLQETEKLQQENHRELVNSLECQKQNLKRSEEQNNKLCEECENLKAQLTNLTRKEAVKDLEIKRYRKIVNDLKTTMMELNTELNKNLAQKELKHSCKNACSRTSRSSNADKDDSKMSDVCMNCPCEVEFYQKMVDILKNSVIELKGKLTDTQQKNSTLEDQVKLMEAQYTELQKSKEEHNQRSLRSQSTDKKICELECEVARLTQELQVRSLQLTDVKRSANEINGSKCVQLVCAQEEIANLKDEMANILNGQYILKRENEELQSQAAQLHCTVNCLNEKNKLFKDQIDQYLLRIKNLTAEKEVLLRKNKELLSELRSIQSMTCSAEKHQRLTTDSLKQLEADIEDLKANKEEICLESKNVIKNVRAWVNEQKKINAFVAKRESEFMDSIKQLNDVKKTPCSNERSTPAASAAKAACRTNRTAAYNNLCTSPCSLGSQGTASFYDGESPPPSPDFGLHNEWYSNTFRTDTENDSEEDYCVNTLENLTQQMKKSNQIWMDERRSRTDCRASCRVTKDVKEKK